MSLWGNKDSKTVAGTIIVSAANSTVIGSGTAFTNFAVNDTLNVGQNDYVITEITNATVMSVRSGGTGGTLVGAASNGSYVVSEKPVYIASGQVGGVLGDVYGVDVGEMEGSPISSTIAITVGGAGFGTAPTIAISAPEHPNGVQATATCTISANAINAVTVTEDGQGYQSVPTITLSGGSPSGEATLTASLLSTEPLAVPHAGWVKRTAGSGDRAGRVHYEVLVASSSVTGDAADDTQLPE